MLGRIRRDRGYPEDDKSIQGVGSLLGGDGVSLDGESVVLPSEYDDMSSINTNTLYDQQGSNAQDAFRIVGHDPDGSTLNDVAQNDGDDDDDRAAAGGGCLPLWLTDAPTWLKAAIVISTALLVGSIVLVGVAAALNASDESGASSRFVGDGDNNEFPSAPSLPVLPITDSPSVTASLQPSSVPISVPTKTPSTSPAPTLPDETGQPSGVPTPVSTSLPTGEPSAVPSIVTESPTADTTDEPTISPTEMPVTPFPSLVPTATVTNAPIDATDAPIVTTDAPVVATDAPTDPLVVPPITGTTTVFYLAAGRPLDDELDLFQENLDKLPTKGDFMVHLGDWNSPFATRCNKASYASVDQLYAASSVPVFFVPGDNEYNDCPDTEEAFGFWTEYLLGYESKYMSVPWRVERDSPDYLENFAFSLRRILYVGINLVGGRVHNDNEWAARQKANLEWIDSNFAENEGDFDVLIIFAHADPDIDTNDDFFEPLFERIQSQYVMPTILIHRNLGVESSSIEQNFGNIPDFVVLVAEGGIWPPMRVEIDYTTGSFVWDQADWFDEL